MDTGCLADVHDLPVRGEHEDEPVQSLQQVRAQLLEDLVSAGAGLHAPALAEALWEHLAHLEEGGGQADDARLVQLAGDGSGQRQQPAQLKELTVFLFPPISGRILTLVLEIKLTVSHDL